MMAGELQSSISHDGWKLILCRIELQAVEQDASHDNACSNTPSPSRQPRENDPGLRSPGLDFDLSDIGLDMSMFGGLPDVEGIDTDLLTSASGNQLERSSQPPSRERTQPKHGRPHMQVSGHDQHNGNGLHQRASHLPNQSWAGQRSGALPTVHSQLNADHSSSRPRSSGPQKCPKGPPRQHTGHQEQAGDMRRSDARGAGQGAPAPAHRHHKPIAFQGDAVRHSMEQLSRRGQAAANHTSQPLPDPQVMLVQLVTMTCHICSASSLRRSFVVDISCIHLHPER